jgi:hypothetical protein
LEIRDLEEVRHLLRRTWAKLYGKIGCPDFTSDYLRWLYDGPDASRHLLYGCRWNGELVGFKGALFRSIYWLDTHYTAHIATHLAIAPELPFALRVAAAGKLRCLHPLEGMEEDPAWETSDLLIAYFEQNKALSRNVRKTADRMGLHQSSTSFRQAILNPKTARNFMIEARGELRLIERHDMRDLLDLLQSMAGDGPRWEPSEPALHHHITTAPGSWSRLVEGNASPRGFMAGYRLDWCKGDQVNGIFIAEFLAYRDPEALALLLRAALDHVETQALRGIVFENASYLSTADQRAAGIMSTPREMGLLLRSKKIPIPGVENFRMDIK